MKKLFYILGVLILPITGLAQDSYIGLSMGGSIPLGTYANETGINTTGYALSGFTLSFVGNYYFMDYLGFHGNLNYGMNSIDEEQLQADWIEYLSDLYPEVDLPPDANIEFSTSRWLYVNLLGGPVLGIPFSKITLEARALIGFSYTRPPERNIRITFTNTELTSFASGQSLAFGYQLGTGIFYSPNNATGIRLGLDYFGSSSKVNIESRRDEGLGNPQTVTETVVLPINTLHVTLGLAYLF